MTSLVSSVALAAPGSTSSQPSIDVDVSAIVGGTTVPEGKWRDVVAVIAADATCTGTLIGPDIVLTAGHCIEAGPYEVRTDTVDLERGDRIPVKWARAYPDWETKYDVGVIMLEHVARGAARKIAPACQAKRSLTEGAMVHLVGFGLTSPSAEFNTQLREVDVPVIDPNCTSDDSCQASIAPHGEFMAGGSGMDSCFGDSGGPVYIPTLEGPALVGVVSRGRAIAGATCGDGGVYVRADKVVAWIQSITGVDLKPTACDGPADEAEGEEEIGGCAVGGGGGPIGAGVGLALLWIRRRRGIATQRARA